MSIERDFAAAAAERTEDEERVVLTRLLVCERLAAGNLLEFLDGGA